MSLDAGAGVTPVSVPPANGTRQGLVSWQHPSAETRISMPTPVLQTLSGEALRWLLSKPPSEIGGILWGRFEGEGKTASAVTIADAEFVFSENSYFNETESDAARLEEAIARKSKSTFEPIGYFRSHIRDGLSLSSQDQKLIQSHLRDPRSIFLLIRPFPLGICMAAFFFWENGRLQTEVSDLEVPFVSLQDPSEKAALRRKVSLASSGAEEPSKKTPEPAASAEMEPARAAVAQTESELVDPVPAVPPARPGKLRILLATAAAAAVFGIGAAWLAQFGLKHWRTVTGSAHPDGRLIGLQVVRQSDGQLDLTWNRNAPAVLSARAGTVSIQDGPHRREIQLDDAQLRSAMLAYFPESDNVQFRIALQVEHHPSVTESLHVVPPPHKQDVTAANEEPFSGNDTALYRPPRPIHQVIPEVEPLQPVALSDGSRVRVRVSVDQSGNVTGAELLPGRQVNERLAAAALRAANAWTFAPATLDGKPVAAQHTISFEFARPGR